VNENTLVRLLVRAGILPSVFLDDDFDASPEGALTVLSRKGLLNEKETLLKMSEMLRLPYLDLESRAVRQKCTFEKFESVLKTGYCRQIRALPLYEERDRTIVGVSNPFILEQVKGLEFALTFPVTLALCEERKLKVFLDELYTSSTSTQFDLLNDLSSEPVQLITQSEDEEIESGAGTTPPAIALCNKIIAGAVREGASDIHIEPSQVSVDIRYRIDGVMRSILEIPKRMQGHVLSRFKILASLDISERRRPQDGRIRVRVGAENLDLRIATIPGAFGEKIVLRLLRTETVEKTLSSLGMPFSMEDEIKDILSTRGKLLLATGPTGSGKTTTLYTCLQFLKDGTTTIETVENPIEYKIPGIHQIQVHEQIGVTFASVLRSVLRQDPDVIMIGEIRDRETAEIALQAAQTGHIVLSTLHTNDAPSAVLRLVNLGLDPYVVATCLAGVLAQRLVRTLCPTCSTTDATPHKSDLSLLEHYCLSREHLRSPIGCAQCGHTGYKGRKGIFSYLSLTDVIVDAIHSKSSIDRIEAIARRSGYHSLEEAGLRLVAEGSTTFDEIRELIPRHRNPNPFQAHEPTPQANSQPGKRKVIVIDDDPDMRALLTQLLTRERCEVIEAHNGSEGLEAYYNHHPSLILCDLSMPILDGKGFLLQLKNNDESRKVPVVILTAEENEDVEVSLLNLGAREFLRKNAPPSVILARLRRVLANVER
jgi:type IV pilus assembly protein PilB